MPHSCILTEIKKWINLTEFILDEEIGLQKQLAIDLSDTSKLATIYFLRLHDINLNKFFLERQFFTVLNSGIEMSSLRFGTVITPRQHSQLDALLKPLDQTTWISMIVCVVSLMIAQKIWNQLSKGSFCIEPIKLVYLLLCQCNITLKCCHLNFKLLLMIPAWYFMSMILTNMYQGELFGYLSTVTVPTAPKTVQDIVQFGFPVVTTSIYTKFENGTVFGYCYVQYIMDFLVSTGTLQEADKVAFSKMLEILRLRGNKPGVVNSNALSVIQFFEEMINSKNISESNVVYLDVDERVLSFKLLVQLFTDDVFIIGDHFGVFDERLVWAAPKDFFLRLVYRFYASIYETGIFSVWERYYNARKMYNFLSDSNTVLKQYFPKMKLNRSILNFVLSASSKLNVPKNKFEPISLSFFLTFGALYGYCFVGSLVCFLLEVLWKVNLNGPKLQLKKLCAKKGWRE